MIRMFIGSSSMGEDEPIEKVYHYSLERNASDDLDITWMRQSNDKDSTWNGWTTNRWSTPFSGFRWAIPELCNWEGRAIYTDCDMINYRDMKELLNIDMEGKPIAARKGKRFGGHEFCVMVFECSHHLLRDILVPLARQKKLEDYHHRMISMFSGSNQVYDLDPRWNCLDGEDRQLGDIYQLHYTSMPTQPWKPGWFTGETQPHPRKDIEEEFWNLSRECVNMEWPVQYESDITYNVIGR